MSGQLDFLLLDAHLLLRGPTDAPFQLHPAADAATQVAPTSRVVELMAVLEASVAAAKKARQP